MAFTIEIANTAEARRKGLMYRTTLKPTAAMLFEYTKPKIVSMWMKNTSIPLDIIFINQHGFITKIHPDAEPFSEKNIPSAEPVIAVLEINAGLTEKLNIKVGDIVDYDLFVNQ